MLQINSDCNWISMLSSGNTGTVGTENRPDCSLLSVTLGLSVIPVIAMHPVLRC